VYRAIDKAQPADEHRGIAMRMYRGMGMTYWLEKLDVEG
jgi:hypothetical protein